MNEDDRSGEILNKAVDNLNSQIEKEVVQDSSTEITEEEFFNVLSGKGIEYITDGDFPIYIKPLRIKQYKLMTKLLKFFNNLSDPNKSEETIDKIGGVFAKLFNVKQEDIEDNCDLDDYKRIVGLLTTVVAEGKDLMKKKKVSVSFQR